MTQRHCGSTRRDDTLLAAYLIDPGRAGYELDDLAAEYGVELVPKPEAEEETTALVRRAETPRRLIAPLLERLEERGVTDLYRAVELPLTGVLAAMEDAGVKIDTYRMGEITARLADRVEELESQAYDLAGEEFMLGSTQQVGRILFEKLEPDGRPQGQDGLLDRREGASFDPARARDHRGHRGVARALEAPEHLPRSAAVADLGLGRAPPHDLQPDGRRDRAACRRPTRTCRRSPFAPSSGVRSAAHSLPRRVIGC